MNICIIGPGAIGTFLAVQLAPYAHITLVDQHTATFAAEEIEVVGLLASRGCVKRGPCVTDADLIMVTTKANHLEAVSSMLEGSAAPVIFWQNGLGINHFARARLPGVRLMRGLIWAGVTRETARVVRCTGFSRIALGVLQGDADPQSLAAYLNKAGLETVLTDSPDCAEWEKSLWNIGVNGLCAIMGERNGATIDSPHLRELLVALVREAQQVAHSVGCDLNLQDSVIRLTRTTAANLNSMLVDVQAGRTTEIEYLNGYVVRLGERFGIETPYNRAVYRLVKHIEARRADDKETV